MAINQTELYKQVLGKKGLECQLRKLQEECGELIAEINHFLEDRPNAKAKMYVELADVDIVLSQIKLALDKKPFVRAKKAKLRRLRKRHGNR